MKSKMSFLVLLGALALLMAFSFKSASNQKVIIIDAGHGGEDAGATFNGKHEKDITAQIAQKVSLLNHDKKLKLILLRDGDQTMSVKERAARINDIKPDMVISLHLGAGMDTKLNGVDALVSPQNKFYKQSRDLATQLLDDLSIHGLAKGKVVESDRSYILRESDCPIVILQPGFMSNQKDIQYISSEAGQQEIAQRIFDFIKQ